MAEPTGCVCDYCNEEIPPGQPWIQLNEYLLSVPGSEDLCWEVPHPEEEGFDGHLLCWPDCAFHFIEYKLLAVGVDWKLAGKPGEE